MKRKTFKNQKGITLIALIITIIVMLILVGVTVNVALNGGLFDTAKMAARRTEKAKLSEELDAIIVAMNADILAAPEEYKESTDDENGVAYICETALLKLEENFEVNNELILEATITENEATREIRILDFEKMIYGGMADIRENGSILIFKVPCTYKENDVTVMVEIKVNEETSIVEIISFALETTDFSITQTGETPTITVGGNVKSVTDDGVPIPKGFYYVTGTKNTGVVISDNEADENNASGNTGNQFVWVSVEANPKLEIKLDSKKVIRTVRILNTKGYDETINVNSDYFEKTINLTDNCAYEIIATYEDGSIDDKIYEANNVYQKSYTPIIQLNALAMLVGISQEEALETLKESALEENPDVVLNTKIDVIKLIEEGYEATEDTALETESVLKYGGFYIGRYEAGTNGTIKKGQYPKGNISFENAKAEAESMYNDNTTYGVKSGMPSAAAWDSIGKWLVNSGAKTWDNVYCSSTDWGNYHPGGSWQVNGNLKASGSSESYSANNIYDLAGNLSEWTTEIEVGKTGNITRGSYYNVRGMPTFYSSDLETAETTYTGYRPILYFYE